MHRPVIVLVGGGTGGSVTPLLAIVDHIGNQKVQWRWIGTVRGPEHRLVDEYNIIKTHIVAGKWRRYVSIKNLLTPFQVAIGFFQSLYWLVRWNADAVIGAGGFVAVPAAWAAAVLGRPVLVIQQDVVVGMANRLMLPIAARAISTIDVSFASSYRLKQFGSLIRSQIRFADRNRALERLHIPSSARILLVIGGGTGSIFLNSVAGELLSVVARDVHIVHIIADRKDEPRVHPQYHPIVFESAFMGDFYAAADCVITRAGMGVLNECAARSCPVVIIPLKGTQQEQNARYLQKKNAAIVIDQSVPLSDVCAQINALLNDAPRQEKIAQTLHATLVQASEKSVEELVEQLVRQRV